MGDSQAGTRVRVGTVGAYMSGSSVDAVRRVREAVGRVTLGGGASLRTLRFLARQEDVHGLDLDPTTYTSSPRGAGLAQSERLGPADALIAEQRRLGLAVVRAPGRLAPAGKLDVLKAALTAQLPQDVVRVVNLEATWLGPRHRDVLLEAVQDAEGPLAFVLAASAEPLPCPDALVGLLDLLRVAGRGGRSVELLRTDATGIGFAAHGGSLGAIGVKPYLRHHSLGPLRNQRSRQRLRQTTPLVFLPGLVDWYRGAALRALAPYRGVGITDCRCGPCAGRSLQRFAEEATEGARAQAEADALAHDLACWSTLAGRVLAAADPAAEWADVCRSAQQAVQQIAVDHKVVLPLPPALAGWM